MKLSMPLFLLPMLVHSHTISDSTLKTSTTKLTPSASTPSPSSLQQIWIPIQTIRSPSSSSPSSPTPSLAPLELREIVVAPPQVLPGDITQVSPVTTLFDTHWVNGIPTPIQIIYSQSFAAVPDQWAAPMTGVIGLGNIKGNIGVAKTIAERAEQTPVATPKLRLMPRSGAAGTRRVSGLVLGLIGVVAVIGIS